MIAIYGSIAICLFALAMTLFLREIVMGRRRGRSIDTHISKNKNMTRRSPACECFELYDSFDAEELSSFILSFYPRSRTKIIRLLNIMLRAIERRNLQFGQKSTSALLKNNGNNKVNDVRLKLVKPTNPQKQVSINYAQHDDEILITVANEGGTTDWQEYMEISSTHTTQPHGAGVALAKSFSFISLEHTRPDRQVCTVNL